MLVSDDLTDFYSAGVTTTNWLEGVAASSNVVVAVGDNAAIYVSTNGVSWKPVTGLLFQQLALRHRLRHEHLCGRRRHRPHCHQSRTEPPGRRAPAARPPTSNRVGWAGNQFLAVGEGGAAFTSPNGTTWQAVTTGATNALYDASGATNSLLVAGNLELRLRETASWSNELSAPLLSPAPSWPYYATVWDGAGYFAAGRSGLTTESYKTNGTTQWYTETNSIRIWLWQVARTPSNYVAVGDLGTILTSPNGIDWDLELTPSSAHEFRAAGRRRQHQLLPRRWQPGHRALGHEHLSLERTGAGPTTNDLQGVCFDGTRFILCGGNGTILTSNNGTNWTKRTTPTNVFLMSVETFPGWPGGRGRLRRDSHEPQLDQLGAPDLGHHQLALPGALPQWTVAGRRGKRHHPRQHQRHQLGCAHQRRHAIGSTRRIMWTACGLLPGTRGPCSSAPTPPTGLTPAPLP